jgi:hypothetical protein
MGQQITGLETTAGHGLEPTGGSSCRLTLWLEWRGFATPIIALFYKGLTRRYLRLEAKGMKQAAEAAN